jgi:RHS repeat-associated protein
LQFDKDGTGDVTGENLSHRYLWGPAVDQLLADEQVTNTQTPGTVIWPLTDQLGTVRDMAVYNAQIGETSVVNHRVFDAYGNLKSETNPQTGQAAAVDCLFAFTGRLYDKPTGLQNNLNRWYDPNVGRWISQDPIDFKSGTTNVCVYCANNPTMAVDPTGLGPDGWWYYFKSNARYVGSVIAAPFSIGLSAPDAAAQIIAAHNLVDRMVVQQGGEAAARAAINRMYLHAKDTGDKRMAEFYALALSFMK